MAKRKKQSEVEYQVCPKCQGHGKIVHEGLSMWTQEDREQDPESFQNMLDGHYDVTCPECQGLRVVDAKRKQEYAEERQDHFTMLMESGIYPGSKDWY